jgi:hypothetical protein
MAVTRWASIAPKVVNGLGFVRFGEIEDTSLRVDIGTSDFPLIPRTLHVV